MSTIRRIDCAEAEDRAAFFVLDALSPREAAEVREHLATCTDRHAEFAELGGVVPYLAELPEQFEPPATLRDRVLDAVAADVRARQRDESAAERLVSSLGSAPRPVFPARGAGQEAAAAGPAETSPPVAAPARASRPAETPVAAPPPPAEVLPAARRGPAIPSLARWLLPAAAVIVIAALGAWNVMLQREVDDARRRAAVLRDAIALAARPGSAVATLAGEGGASGASGIAVLPSDGAGYLVVRGLPPAPQGKAYEAWYVTPEGARPAGLLELAPDGTGTLGGLRREGAVESIALTLEDARGADRPTSPILVRGRLGP